MEKYYISKGITKKGPYTIEQLKGQKIRDKTMVWKEGLSDWISASELSELKAIIEIQPPNRVKSLDHFIDESDKEKINYMAIIFCCVVGYLFCSLVLFDGYNALSMKSEIDDNIPKLVDNLSDYRDRIQDKFNERQIVYESSYFTGYKKEPAIDVISTLDAVILNAFGGFITILITVLIFLFGYGLRTFGAFGKYIQQFPELLD